MRLSRFLTGIISVTFVCLIYVYQQSEIFRLAYVGQRKQSSFQDLLDKNSVLRYNINSSSSLVRLSNKITGCADFQMPDSYRLMRVTSAKQGLVIKSQARQQEPVLARIFGIRTQAEARTINP